MGRPSIFRGSHTWLWLLLLSFTSVYMQVLEFQTARWLCVVDSELAP